MPWLLRRCRGRGGRALIERLTCFAARVMREAAMENPTIVVITDRNDLDGQLFGVFSLSKDLLREQPVQADSRDDLRSLLANRPSGGIVFATIQKFMLAEGETVFPALSERHNIVVIADEAHRTQYSFEAKLKGKPGAERYQVGYAQHLRDALPNATFVAFRQARSVAGWRPYCLDRCSDWSPACREECRALINACSSPLSLSPRTLGALRGRQ
ncbi:DEAD/DEAH box helicase family protein [Uliginosibacterium paludis]|uniref:DEAD/DEAH box helicase family protein n=1 Tax=Uliginosibacterium paludis TaxID=1615952 RepID=A0ABV2CRU8_9RHOO